MNRLKCLGNELISSLGRGWIEGLITDLNLCMEHKQFRHATKARLQELRHFADEALGCVSDADLLRAKIRVLNGCPTNTELFGNGTKGLYTKMSDGTWLRHSDGQVFYAEDVVECEGGDLS